MWGRTPDGHSSRTSANARLELKKAVTVSVAASGKFYVDRDEVALATFDTELRSLHAVQPDLAVHLNADEATNYRVVAKVMSAVDRAGVTKLSVLTLDE